MRAFWNLNEISAQKYLIQIQIQVSESKFDNLALDNISSLTMKLITQQLFLKRILQKGTVISHADEL